MTRFEILDAVLKEELAKPYRYGSADCFFLGLRMATAFGHKGLITRYRRRYTTLRGAQRALRKDGHKSLVTLFAALLEPCAPAMARIGDLGIVQIGNAEHVAICLGTRFITKTEAGPSYHDITAVIAAFRAG